MRPGTAAALLFFALGPTACGSSASDPLFAGGRGTGGAPAGSGGAAVSGTGGAPDAGPGSGGADGHGSGGDTEGPDARVTGTGGTAAVDSGPPPSPLHTPTPNSVACEGTPCDTTSASAYCCVGTPPFPTTCLPICANGPALVLACDDAADCPAGMLCCGNLGGQNAGSRCVSSCPSPGIQLCETGAECHSGRCAPLKVGSPYGACQ